MARESKTTSTPRVAVEDVLVGVLGLATGPLMWWMSSKWQQLPAASSSQTLEYWIASICGFLGIALCALWAFYCLAGFGLILGLKTRNTVLAYWSEILTPQFLRRLIIAVVGTQVALTSQAFAAPTHDQPTELESIQPHEPFMPYLHEEPTEGHSISEPPATDSSTPTPQPSDSPSKSAPDPSLEPSTPLPSPTVEQRQESQLTVTPEITTTPSEDLVPTPRQTSTVNVVPKETIENSEAARLPEEQQSFIPQQPVPSPSISAPNHSRSTDEPTVIIKTGDCLWDIAAHELGTDASLFEIDRRWRQWWDHNRDTIGEDPHTLSPGTVLSAPPFSS